MQDGGQVKVREPWHKPPRVLLGPQVCTMRCARYVVKLCTCVQRVAYSLAKSRITTTSYIPARASCAQLCKPLQAGLFLAMLTSNVVCWMTKGEACQFRHLHNSRELCSGGMGHSSHSPAARYLCQAVSRVAHMTVCLLAARFM